MNQYQTIAADSAVIGRSGAIRLHGPEGFAGMRPLRLAQYIGDFALRRPAADRP